MAYLHLVYLHLGTIFPAFLIGTYLLVRRKGTATHKLLGKIYMVLMLATALITLFMPAQVGPSFAEHFGFIHLLSVFVMYSVTAAFLAVRRGDVKSHRVQMIGLYVGGILVAGTFALMPGRLLHDWFFG